MAGFCWAIVSLSSAAIAWKCCRPTLDQATLDQVDLMLTDPPYDLAATGGGIVSRREYLGSINGFTDGGFDYKVLDFCKNWVCFCSKNQLIQTLSIAEKMPRWMLCTWNKPNPTPLSNGNYLPDTEYIVHGFQSGRCFGGYK